MKNNANEGEKRALIIIPVLNEELKLDPILKNIPKKVLDIPIDVLVVDDGSEDESRQVAKRNNCFTIRHRKRMGYGASVRDGFAYAINNGYEYILKMDGDGQHETTFIPTVIKILARGDTDYVVSSRYLREADRMSNPPLQRQVVNIMMTGAVNRITGMHLSDVFCGFFGMRTAILKHLPLTVKEYGLELELLIKSHANGARILEIPHPLIYTKEHSKFTQVFGREHNLGMRLELYTNIIMNTLEELKIKRIK